MSITTADEIRAIEVREDEIGTGFLALMEKAGSGCAELIMEEYAPEDGPVTVVCGSGKNGGDGFVIGIGVDAEYAAFFVKLVFVERVKILSKAGLRLQ